jgi:hypothetical protein
VLARFLRQTDGFDHDLLNWHTGERYVWPDWDSGSRPSPMVNATGVYWRYEIKVLDENFQPPFPEFPGPVAAILPGVRAGTLLWGYSSAGGEPQLLLSRWSEDGKIATATALPSHTFWRPSLVPGQNMVAGSMTWPDIGQLPTLVDAATGEVTRIRAPFEALAKQNDRNVVLAAQAGGNLARVNTPGTCLNLRKEQNTTSEILTCIGDGALMTVYGADNVTMLPVAFGEWSGWVSPDFVEVPARAR